MGRPQAVIHSGFGSLLQDAAQKWQGGSILFLAGFFFRLNQAFQCRNANFECRTNLHFHGFLEKLVVIAALSDRSKKVERPEAGHQ